MSKVNAHGVSWRSVTPHEFESLLKCYPRGLVADPPLGKECQRRVFFDPHYGLDPADAIAVVNTSRRGATFVVRTNIDDWPMARD